MKLLNMPNEVLNIMDNKFLEYTNYLANVLQSKNDAYGNSFTKSVDEDGLLVLKICLACLSHILLLLIRKI